MITPEEKSNEIIEKYYKLFSVTLENTISKYEATHCAIAEVTGIISSNPHSNPFNTDVYSTMEYWQEVKTILENKLK